MASRPHPRTQNAPELKVAGRNACRALFEKRPHDIRRVYITDENIPFFSDALKWCARERIAYHVKTTADLDAVAETVHHDGVMFIARERPQPTLADVIARVRDARAACIVVLEDVKNPHNLGAILRVCAHFGVDAVLAVRDTPHLSPAAMRTAEGGAEHVDVVAVDDGVAAVRQLRERAGFRVLATSSHTKSALGGAGVTLPARAVVMFGSEGEGLSRALMDVADDVVAIPGSGALESLNVACAASVVLWELWRAQHAQHAQHAQQAQQAQQAQHAHGASAGSRASAPSAPPQQRSRNHAAPAAARTPRPTHAPPQSPPTFDPAQRKRPGSSDKPSSRKDSRRHRSRPGRS